MLTPYKIADYCKEYQPEWTCTMPDGCPQRNWGSQLPLAVGLSLIDNEQKARRNLKLPMFRQYRGIIALVLNPTDGMVRQTGAHRSHYTWWRTQKFQMSNLTMLKI